MELILSSGGTSSCWNGGWCSCGCLNGIDDGLVLLLGDSTMLLDLGWWWVRGIGMDYLAVVAVGAFVVGAFDELHVNYSVAGEIHKPQQGVVGVGRKTIYPKNAKKEQ